MYIPFSQCSKKRVRAEGILLDLEGRGFDIGGCDGKVQPVRVGLYSGRNQESMDVSAQGWPVSGYVTGVLRSSRGVLRSFFLTLSLNCRVLRRGSRKERAERN